jgi:hypothetical protein
MTTTKVRPLVDYRGLPVFPHNEFTMAIRIDDLVTSYHVPGKVGHDVAVELIRTGHRTPIIGRPTRQTFLLAPDGVPIPDAASAELGGLDVFTDGVGTVLMLPQEHAGSADWSWWVNPPDGENLCTVSVFIAAVHDVVEGSAQGRR